MNVDLLSTKLGSVIVNGLPWKQTEIILSFLRLHPSTAFQTLLLTMMAMMTMMAEPMERPNHPHPSLL